MRTRIMVVSMVTVLGFAAACVPPTPGPVRLLAVAYTDVDGVDGYGADDVLVAKLEDANRDGVPSPGDRVVTARYPLDFEGTAFGTFRETVHTVGEVHLASAGSVAVIDTGKRFFLWNAGSLGQDLYEEIVVPAEPDVDPIDLLLLDEHAVPSQPDVIAVPTGAPSDPDTEVDKIGATGGDGDQAFLDVRVPG